MFNLSGTAEPGFVLTPVTGTRAASTTGPRAAPRAASQRAKLGSMLAVTTVN